MRRFREHSRLRIVAISLLAACGSNTDPCEGAIANAFGAREQEMTSVLGIEPAEVAQVRALAARDCKMRPWRKRTLECLTKAADGAALRACAAHDDFVGWQSVVIRTVDPRGVRRYPDLDAIVAELTSVVGVASAEMQPCTKPLSVVVFEREMAENIAKRSLGSGVADGVIRQADPLR